MVTTQNIRYQTWPKQGQVFHISHKVSGDIKNFWKATKHKSPQVQSVSEYARNTWQDFSGSYNCGLNLCLRKHKVQERGSEQNDTTKKGKIHLVFHYCHAEHQVDNYVFRDFIIVMAYSPNAIVPPKNAQRLLSQNFLCLQKMHNASYLGVQQLLCLLRIKMHESLHLLSTRSTKQHKSLKNTYMCCLSKW